MSEREPAYTRGEFLRMAAAAAAAWGSSTALLRGLARAEPGEFRPGPVERPLVLLELKGGNDGLNTVVPYADPLYYELRRRLAVPRERVLQLDGSLGLNPALEPLWESWRERELAVALGVGYDSPNRSHFRSIDIWETASGSGEYLSEGWLSRLLALAPAERDSAADGIVLGEPEPGPLSGGRTRAIVLGDPEKFFARARRVREPEGPARNPALAHILKVQGDVRHAAEVLERRLSQAPALDTPFPKGRLGRQLESVARLLVARTPVPVYKATLGGFDTHSAQQAPHERLLKELAEGLAAFRTALRRANLWNKTLVLTYSEFGRRARENASAGTDHGTAAPHFFLGGGVRGGLYGRQPPLDRLADGDLVHAVDFRRLYATVGKSWWGVGRDFLPGGSYPVLDCLG